MSLPRPLLRFVLIPFTVACGFLPSHAQELSAPVQAAKVESTQVVRSAEELRTSMAMGSTPLDAFTAYGKRRFLRGLIWGSKGIGGLPSGEMKRELKPEQILALARWLNVENQVQNLLGFAAQFPPLRLAEPSAELEQLTIHFVQRMDQFSTTIDPQTGTSLSDYTGLKQHFDQEFASYLAATRLPNLSDSDMVLLFDTLSQLAQLTSDRSIVGQQTLIYHELQRRGIDTRRDINRHMLHSMLDQRQFSQAKVFIAQHPELQETIIPNEEDHLPGNFAGRSVLAYAVASNTLQRQAVQLAAGRQLVMVVDAGCQFSQNALTSINNDARIKTLAGAANILTLTPPSNAIPFHLISRWNAQASHFPIYAATNRQEWPEIDRPGVPQFYVYEQGKLAQVIEGWLGAETLERLVQALSPGTHR